jgi:uncharacterized protein
MTEDVVRTDAASVKPVPSGPVTSGERIVSMDVLRGFAILGILVMNVQSFSMIEAAYLNPTAYGDLSGVNRLVWTLSHLFADQKFISIFSMLFGAGIVLFATRLKTRGVRPGPVHYRRTFWLLFIGLAHGFLLWYGDILAIYALMSFIVYLFWRRSPTALLITGLIVVSVSSGLYWLSGTTITLAPPQALEGVSAFWSPSQEAIAADMAAMGGSWTEQMAVRVPGMAASLTVVLGMFYAWRTGGLMLVGMALYKWGVLSAERSRRFYTTVAAAGFVIGLPVIYQGVVRRFADGWSVPYSFFHGWQYNYWGSLFVAMAYVAVVMLLVRSGRLARLRLALAAAGRMAFTNYLMQTVICTTIFYGHGLGLYGQVDRVYQALIVLAIWALQLWFSSWWLERFRFGPAEWLWRTLTYAKAQPMRLRSPAS